MQYIFRDATAMLATGTGPTSAFKPDIEYEYNAMRQRVTKIVKPRDQVTKALKPSWQWKYTYYVYDASGNVMAVYDRATTLADEHYKASVGLAEHHIYGSNRLALTRPALPVEWSYWYSICSGEGEGSECRTILTTNEPADSLGRTARYLGYKEFELNNHLGNVIATVSDREVTEYNSTTNNFNSNNEGRTGPGVTWTGTQMQLSTATAYDAIEKTITTIPGHSYRVRYTVTYNPGSAVVEGEAYPVPVTPPFLVNVAAPINPSSPVNSEFVFTATTNQTVLRIQRGADGAGSATFRVDDIIIDTISGYLPDLLLHTDYYAFGQQMPGRKWAAQDYRYGMNGQEKQDELFVGANSAEYWMYDARIGRRWELDPVVKRWESRYATFNNSPISVADPKGLDGEKRARKHAEKNGGDVRDLGKGKWEVVKAVENNDQIDVEIATFKDNLFERTAKAVVGTLEAGDRWINSKKGKPTEGREFEGLDGPVYNADLGVKSELNYGLAQVNADAHLTDRTGNLENSAEINVNMISSNPAYIESTNPKASASAYLKVNVNKPDESGVEVNQKVAFDHFYVQLNWQLSGFLGVEFGVTTERIAIENNTIGNGNLNVIKINSDGVKSPVFNQNTSQKQ